MIAFIDDHREAYGVEPMCRVLPIAPSTYHAHLTIRRDPSRASARARREAVLCAEIARVWEANYRVYGVRKVWPQLKRGLVSMIHFRKPPRKTMLEPRKKTNAARSCSGFVFDCAPAARQMPVERRRSDA